MGSTVTSAPVELTGFTNSTMPKRTRTLLICLINSCFFSGNALKSCIKPAGLPQLKPPSLSFKSTFRLSDITVLTYLLGALAPPITNRLYINLCMCVLILTELAKYVSPSGISSLYVPPLTVSTLTLFPLTSAVPMIGEWLMRSLAKELLLALAGASLAMPIAFAIAP